MSYRVYNWNALYETHESRKLKNLKWIPIPNKHDGAGFRRIAERKDACEIFTAWVLLLQIASKAEIRGNLPELPGDAGYKTGYPVRIFEKAYSILTSKEINWIEIYGKNAETGDSPGIPAELPGTPGDLPDHKEGNNKEGKEGEGKHSRAESVLLKDSEYQKLTEKMGTEEETRGLIEFFSRKKQMKGYIYKSDYLAILDWGIRAYKENREKSAPKQRVTSGGLL